MAKVEQVQSLFEQFRSSILNICPVQFCENNLTLDGKPFRLNGNGYKPFADIYRYIGIKALEKDSKPVILVKGRQVGATTMAAALEGYFMASGLFGTGSRPPMRIMHLFPTLSLAAGYTKDKLDPIISASKPVPGLFKNNGTLKSFLESKLDSSSPSNNSKHFKRFLNGNQIWIESTGADGDRVRGKTVDAAFYDECFPYDQYIVTENGKEKIGQLYDMWLNGEQLPLVQTYNEKENKFEYKKILNTWNRGVRDLFLINCLFGDIECTLNHRFLTNKGWKRADKLNINESIVSFKNGEYNLEKTKNIKSLNKKENVYDIEVEGNHNFIVIPKGYNDNDFGLVAHNCQDIPAVAIGASTKVLTKAQYGAIGDGIQVYFGTPKQKGTAYYNMWKASSQQYFHLHCESCDKYFPLYRPDVNWEEIWLYGFQVRCTHCSHEQDKREAAERGKWLSILGEEGDNCKYIGYHINQLYIPEFTKEKILGAKPESNPANTEAIYQNEVLGEFYDGQGGTVSMEEIHEKCADHGRRFVKRIDLSDPRKTYAGFDWGQRGDWDQLAGKQRGQSYSCGVVLTLVGPQLFQIEFATRLGKTDYQSKIDTVEEMYRRYNIYLSVGDIGDAGDLTHALQRKYNDRFLSSRAAQKVNGHIKYVSDIFPKEIVFERDYYISELIDLIKKGNIRFPYGSYEKVQWLITHCCSMEIKITSNRSGDPIRRFVKGSSPNDGFMALLNAYLAYKFDITQGFKIKAPMYMKTQNALKKPKIPALIARLPKV